MIGGSFRGIYDENVFTLGNIPPHKRFYLQYPNNYKLFSLNLKEEVYKDDDGNIRKNINDKILFNIYDDIKKFENVKIMV
jgi:hypothetical protein